MSIWHKNLPPTRNEINLQSLLLKQKRQKICGWLSWPKICDRHKSAGTLLRASVCVWRVSMIFLSSFGITADRPRNEILILFQSFNDMSPRNMKKKTKNAAASTHSCTIRRLSDECLFLLWLTQNELNTFYYHLFPPRKIILIIIKTVYWLLSVPESKANEHTEINERPEKMWKKSGKKNYVSCVTEFTIHTPTGRHRRKY